MFCSKGANNLAENSQWFNSQWIVYVYNRTYSSITEYICCYSIAWYYGNSVLCLCLNYKYVYEFQMTQPHISCSIPALSLNKMVDVTRAELMHFKWYIYFTSIVISRNVKNVSNDLSLLMMSSDTRKTIDVDPVFIHAHQLSYNICQTV